MLKQNPLIQFAGVPVSGAELRSCFANLSSPEKKIQALEREGALIRLKRNLFVVNKELTGRETHACLCANHLYGPSYVSLQWALRYYGLIPERVFVMTSVTTKRSRSFKTPLGLFSYVQVSSAYFPVGVSSVEEGGARFLMASPEKALCDTILHDRFVPHQSVRALATYLEEDMRLDMEQFQHFDGKVIRECREAGRKVQVFTNLIKLIR
ncbi:MAG: hypothetical protein IJQ61_10025 [Bacteroidales bacterium]|nr:hypothetical protein [Bacteroidales bacterium]